MISLIVALYAFWIFPTSPNAQLEDGVYSLNYQVNKAGDISASIANDYFAKPAKLFIENGKARVQLTVKQSAWITEFSGPHGGNKEISQSKEANTRLVEFAVSGINSPTVMKMKVDIAEMSYHHEYSSDFVWDTSSLKLLEATKKPEPVVEANPKEEVKLEVPAQKPVQPIAEEKIEVKEQSKEAKPEPKAQAVEEKKVVEQPVAGDKNPVATAEVVKEPEAVKVEVVEEPKEEQKEVSVEMEKDEPAKVEETLTAESTPLAAPAEEKAAPITWIYILVAVVVAVIIAVVARKKLARNNA